MNNLNFFECNYIRPYSKAFTNYKTDKIYEYELRNSLNLKTNENYRKWLQNNSKKLNKINKNQFHLEKIYKYNCN